MVTLRRSVCPRFLLLLALPCLLAAQPSVLLTASPNPSVFGAPVVLTAAVTPPTATGHVTFYDGVTILGTKPLASGVASMSTILLPPGKRRLRAIYAAPSVTPASSNIVTQQVNASAGGSFIAQPPINLPSTAFSSAVADFNGDGRADFALNAPNGVLVFLGKGDGTFQAPIQSPGAGGYLAVGDFNGDGIPDLFCGGVLLGNGDGTFRQGVSYPSSQPVFVADVNLDGNADVLSGSLLLLGNGDGTFISQTLASADSFAVGGVGDFNGDGKPDLAVLSTSCDSGGPGVMGVRNCSTSVSVELGNGNGTFQSPVVLTADTFTSPKTGGLPIFSQPVIADVNGDGKPDLIDCFGGTVKVFPGNGDGTFGAPQTISLPSGFTAAATAGDFNGDGITDLAVAIQDAFYILTGNGDGTFQQSGNAYYGMNQQLLTLAVADFNGDGKADLLIDDGGSLVTVYLGAAAGAGYTLTPTGTPQSTFVETDFRAPLQVTLRNNGTPVSGATVTFEGAILSSNTAVTNASGVASVTATAGINPGSYFVTARSQGVQASFALTNIAVSLTTAAGTPQSTPVGTVFPTALQVKVSGGSPPVGVAGVPVQFVTPSIPFAGALLSSATAVTDANGIATVTATANSVAGSYNVVASLGTYNSQVSFALTNTPAGSPTDLAVGKTATQSSTYSGNASSVAGSAVDGNTDGAFFHGSVTATNADPNAWWQVDLGASASISSIVIWNRTDCCGSRLSDYWVFVSDTPFLATDTPATLQNRAGTFASHQTTAPNPSATIAVNGAQGRYVRVQLSDTDYLSLAEVQVFGAGGAPPPSDLAQGKTATQSSTYSGNASSVASSAVDGSTDGAFFDGSVTATNADPNAWWQVDLGASASISSIVIWNRTDCCGSRLSDYWVFVSDTPFLATDTPATLQNRAGTFASHQTTAPNPSTTITGAIQGRYVRVQLSGTDYLSLAEVQVFGTGGAPGPTNVAQGKTATQSSTYPGYSSAAASSAVDGNTDGKFFDGSVTATNLDPNPWWQVDLGASPAITSIVIWNRTDLCCSLRLSDYWVFVSNTPFLSSNNPSTLMNRAGTFASHQTMAPSPSTAIPVGAQGRYVRVQLSSADYLSLAEVQVFGQ